MSVASLLTTPSIPSSVQRMLAGFKLWFSQRGKVSRCEDPEVESLAKSKQLYLSVKQVPSCTMLRCPGSVSVYRNKDDLINAGFRIETSHSGTWMETDFGVTGGWNKHVSASQVGALSSYLSSIANENHMTHGDKYPDDHAFETSMEDVLKKAPSPQEGRSSSDSESEFSHDAHPVHRGKPGATRLIYQDPWKVNAALVYADSRGWEAPKVYVWSGDVTRLTDKIPVRLLGPDWNGRQDGTGVPFYDIGKDEVKDYVIFRRTHWGKTLSGLAADAACEEHTWALGLKKKIKYLLKGKHDPRWNNEAIVRFYGTRDYVPRSKKSRATRLLQVLLTVDGVFQQRYLAFPNEAWTWQKFDMFVLGTLSLLISDEFHDGVVLNKGLLSEKTAYARLKGVRQSFKENANKGTLRELLEGSVPWDEPFFEIYRLCYAQSMESEEAYENSTIRGILSQTRGAGTPPPLAVLQVKMKFIQTVTQPPEPLTRTERVLIRSTIRELLNAAPDEAFTGLQTKAGVRAATSACYEKTREEGGTAQAIQDIVYEGTLGRPCLIRDLWSGELVEEKILNNCTPGEYIFWRSLEEVLATQPDDLRRVYLIVVGEPGKGRAVTKGAACLKVVLDVVNSLCSWALQKAFKSSASGMSKEAHGWNFYKSFFHDFEEYVFDASEIATEHVDASTKFVTKLYRDIEILNTDLETATDFTHHEVAEEIGLEYMTKVGIPNVLKGVVVSTCFRPRLVEFSGIGVFDQTGDPTDVENVRQITLLRGVLMGDPLTKVILHLINIGVRELSWRVNDINWLAKICANPADIAGRVVTPNDGDFPPLKRVST
jgi:hypothetical protein